MKRAVFAVLLVFGCGRAATSSGKPDSGSVPDAGDSLPAPDAGIPAPPQVKVRSVLPATGPASGGGTALISGAGFVEGFALRGGSDTSRLTSVLFGATAATAVNVIDDNRVEVVVPAAAAGTSTISVTNPNGTGSCDGCYRYVTPVVVTSIDPPAGGPGTAVTVHGDGFTPEILLTIGGRELISPQIVDAKTITGRVPAGAGAADVRAVTRDGNGVLRSGFVYLDALRVDGVSPPVIPTAGEKVVVAGAGFSPMALVRIDGADAQSAWIDSGHIEVLGPAHASGAVQLSVDGAAGTLVYADAGGTSMAYAIEPAHGPAAGGTCPRACIHVFGTGLTAEAVSVGGASATVHVVSDVQLDVDLPAGTVGPAGVQVGSQTFSFQYDPLLAVASVAPQTAPVAGGTQIAVTGQGFDLPNLRLFIGALPATIISASATGISALAPAGSAGPAEVRVTAGGQQAALDGAFNFTEPMAILQVSPAQGAQAGGTRVTLYGRGFNDGIVPAISGSPMSGVSLASPTELTGLTPKGTPGAKDVAAGSAVLNGGFTYFDPAAPQGGGTGGPLLGTLNVTVLDDSAFKDGGVAEAAVQVVLHDGTLLAALTDANGQVTFSDGRLVLPAQVTAMKDQYNAITVQGVRTANLTVALQGPIGTPPPPPSNPPPPPPAPQPATVAGHVYGFKLPPGTSLTSTQRPVARVSIARSGVYALPPFSGPPAFFTVSDDGGPFLFDKLYSLSPLTLYAVFGIEDSAAKSFQPILLGIARGVQPDPAKTVNADLILDTHLDQTVEVTVLDVPSVLGGHDAYLDLDLGQAGAIPIDRVTENTDLTHFRFQHLPRAAGQGFVFVDQFGRWSNGLITTPVTTYLRRVFGDLSSGVTLGPLLPFPVLQQEGPATFSWTVGAGALQANLQQLRVQDGTPTQDTSWSVLLPGDARQVTMPDPLRARLQSGSHGFSLVTSVSPNFDYAHWTYNDLFSGNWTAYAFTDGSFTAP